MIPRKPDPPYQSAIVAPGTPVRHDLAGFYTTVLRVGRSRPRRRVAGLDAGDGRLRDGGVARARDGQLADRSQAIARSTASPGSLTTSSGATTKPYFVFVRSAMYETARFSIAPSLIG
jgi:hypothetical protein